MAGARFSTSLKKDGPWFAHDPVKTFRDNVYEMMVGLAREGAADVRGQLRAGDGNRAPIRAFGGHVSDRVTGEIRRTPAGSRYSAVVFVSTRGMSRAAAISTHAAASFLEGSVHPFRKTAGRISRSRLANADELLKGLT